VLCGVCRRQVGRGATYCSSCGAPVKGKGAAAPDALELVLHDGTRVPIAQNVTIGRAPDNLIQLEYPTVSRHHARILVDGGPPEIEDVGSSAGTFINGRRLKGKTRLGAGLSIRVGDMEMRVERRREEADAGKTIVIRPGATVLLQAAGQAQVDNTATQFGFKPRVRSGWALKRLEASEGEKRNVLKDLRGNQYVRMADDEAALFQLLDGKHSLVEIMSEAERRYGPQGAGKVAGLLSDLGDRGFLEGVEKEADAPETGGRMKRMMKARDFTFPWAGPMFEKVYRAGGFLLFTRPAYVLMGAVAVLGAGVWVYMVAARYGTPFVVARKIGLGGLVFLLGRFVMVAFHELGHGLTVASFGRRVTRAGFKVMMVFPYAFVDTSEAWFEPKRRRIAISAAGPVSDFVVAGAFSLIGFALAAGTIRDIMFNLAFAAYIGGLFNLNPFLERDGYHMLVDLLREPGLRRRSKQWLSSRLIGQPLEGTTTPFFKIYAVTSTIWLASGLIFAIIGSIRLYPALIELAPREVVWAALGFVYLLCLLPVIIVVGRPLLVRRRVTFAEAESGSS
jgi:putative peptide zinc metalloprotease protein